jgi:hypothetical protein
MTRKQIKFTTRRFTVRLSSQALLGSYFTLCGKAVVSKNKADSLKMLFFGEKFSFLTNRTLFQKLGAGACSK